MIDSFWIFILSLKWLLFLWVESTFTVGDEVRMRDDAEIWLDGIVKQTNPLLIKYDDQSEDSTGFVFKQVQRKTSVNNSVLYFDSQMQ